MNIQDIENALRNEDESPPDLVKYETILAGYFSYYGQMLKRIELNKPEIWLDIQEAPTRNGDKPFSDKKTEMKWAATENGKKEIALEWELKRIEKMMSAINKRLYVDNVAVRNQY